MVDAQLHILFEHADWLPPLEAACRAEGLVYQLQAVRDGVIDCSVQPAAGIYLNRVSPSSHTRGHVHAIEFTQELLAWLEAHGRRVVNGSRAFLLETSKLRQDLALRRHGIRTPRTVLVVGVDELVTAAQTFSGPFLTKHNCGGKGIGVQRFACVEELQDGITAQTVVPDARGQIILQEYIAPREPFITRVEIVGGRFLFAMQSATVGGFELCPSDVCQVPPVSPDVCPADGSGKFTPSPVCADDPLVQQYLAMCQAEGIEVAGIEFIEDVHGDRYTYDINGTTNYSSTVGAQVGIDGMREIVRYVRRAL
jgi:hypothetical protein